MCIVESSLRKELSTHDVWEAEHRPKRRRRKRHGAVLFVSKILCKIDGWKGKTSRDFDPSPRFLCFLLSLSLSLSLSLPQFSRQDKQAISPFLFVPLDLEEKTTYPIFTKRGKERRASSSSSAAAAVGPTIASPGSMPSTKKVPKKTSTKGLFGRWGR